MTVPDVTFDYGKKGTSNTTFTGATGINATVNDTNTVVEIDGSVITVSNLTVGTYTLTVTTVPDANHKKTTKTADITVNKADSKVSVDVPDIYYGSSANVNATYEGATGITATIAGKNLTVKDNTIIIPDDLDAGPYVLTVITVPDENHNEITEYFEIYVNPANSTIDVDDAETDYGKSVDINVTYEGATGITAKLNDKNLTVKNNTITIPNDLDAGTYNLIVTTTTDSNHNPTTKTTTVTVNRINSTLTVPDITFNYGETGTATTTYTGATGVRASVNDTGAHVEINGRSITVSNLPAGTYTLTVTTIPDDNHNSTEKTAKVTVNKVDSTITAGDITFEYGLTGKTTVSYTGASGFNATIEKGTVQIEGNSIIVSGLNPGNYTLNMTTIPDVSHNAVSKSIKVKVNKATTEITAPGTITVYNINKYLTITLKDNKNSTIAGAKITVNINGAKTYTTDKNGQVKINTKTLTPKVYNAKITFAGNATHSKSQATSYILSIKATPILTAKNKTFKSTDKTKKYSVSLRNNLKAPLKKFHVKLTIGKTTYKTTTNAKGIATFKLTKLTKTSQATVKYLGNKNYNAASKKVKLTVKKVFKTISKGSKNHAMVKKIQKALISKGYYKSPSGKAYAVDGIYGDHTEKAVKQFQKAKKLKVTGKVDEKTAKKLGIIK